LDTNALISGDVPKLTACLERGMNSAEYRDFAATLQKQFVAK
jgi:hypothetical protein